MQIVPVYIAIRIGDTAYEHCSEIITSAPRAAVALEQKFEVYTYPEMKRVTSFDVTHKV